MKIIILGYLCQMEESFYMLPVVTTKNPVPLYPINIVIQQRCSTIASLKNYKETQTENEMKTNVHSSMQTYNEMNGFSWLEGVESSFAQDDSELNRIVDTLISTLGENGYNN